MKGKTYGTRADSTAVGLTKGVLTAIACMAAMACALAFAMQKEILELESAGYGVVFLLMVGSFAGCAAANRSVQRMVLKTSAMYTICICALLTCIAVFVFKAEASGIGVMCSLTAAGSGLYLLLGKHGKKATKQSGRIRVKL